MAQSRSDQPAEIASGSASCCTDAISRLRGWLGRDPESAEHYLPSAGASGTYSSTRPQQPRSGRRFFPAMKPAPRPRSGIDVAGGL